MSGRVIADDTGDPIANARVAVLTGQPRFGPSAVLTDDDGRFTLARSGAIRLAASKTGYGRRVVSLLDKEYLAALAPRARTVTIRDGQKQSIDLRISGR